MKWDVGGHIIHMLFGEFPTVFPFIAGKAGRKCYETTGYEMWYNSLNDALVRTDNKGRGSFFRDNRDKHAAIFTSDIIRSIFGLVMSTIS